MSSPHYKSAIFSRYLMGKEENSKLVVKPCELDITWGGDSRYWLKPAGPTDPAELVQVSWLEVSGSIDLDKLKAGKEYRLCFKGKLKPNAFGWKDSPVNFTVKPGKAGIQIWRKVDLSIVKVGESFEIPRYPKLKFKVPEKVDGEKLQFGMYETRNGRWKGGLVIDGVVIEPVSG